MSPLMRHSLFPLLLVALPAPALVLQAPLEQAGWQVEQGPKVCRLRQAIPRLGEVVFEQVGTGDRFFVQLSARELAGEGPLAPGPATLAAVAPYWNPQREARPLGNVAVAEAGVLVDIDGEQAARLLQGLKAGLAAEISGRARSGEASVQVVALPVYFQRAWRDYDRCVQKLPPPPQPVATTVRPGATSAGANVRLARVETTPEGLLFDYAPGESQLQPAHRTALESVRQALLADPSLRVTIDGYGNDSYRRLLNLELSRKRAQTVSDLLTAGGIDASRIVVRFHGDEKINARRVVVRVE